MRRLFLLLAFLLFALPLAAQNATTAGTPTALANFYALSYRSPFTGDANANNSATVRFSVTGSGAWKTAYPPIIDRRATIVSTNDNVVNQYQARGSIVGSASASSPIQPNTSY